MVSVMAFLPLNELPALFPHVGMKPNKEHTEHEENGVNVERTVFDDPETKTHVEEIKIEKTEDEPEQETTPKVPGQILRYPGT